MMDADVVKAIVLLHYGKCPPLGRSELQAKVTYAMLGDSPEKKEAKRIISKKETP